MIDPSRFAEIYNDVQNFPFVRDVAAHFHMGERTARRLAARLKTRDNIDLIDRTGRASSATRDITTVLPNYEEPIEDLIERAQSYNERFGAYRHQKGLVDIAIKTEGPFGVVGLPDNHLNNIGTELKRAFDDARFIRDHPALYAVGIGDWIDNFIIGKLEAVRRKDIMSHADSWRLLEYYIDLIADKLVIAISGNHLDWQAKLGGYDVLKRVFEENDLAAIYDSDQVRVRLNCPNGASFVHLARHKFNGRSKYNAMHAITSWILEQWQGEDVIWGGHVHIAGHASIERFWQNERRVVHGIQLASYKTHDDYAIERGFRPNAPFLTPMIVHRPDTRTSVFFEDMYDGVKYLDYIR